MPQAKHRGSPSGPLDTEALIIEVDLATVNTAVGSGVTAPFPGLRTTDIVSGVNLQSEVTDLFFTSAAVFTPGVVFMNFKSQAAGSITPNTVTVQVSVVKLTNLPS